MAKNERVFLAESDPQVRQVTKLFLEQGGHTVVFQTGNMKEAAQTMLDADFTVAVLGDERDLNNRDRNALAQKLQEKVPEAAIVIFSGLPFPEGDHGYINVSKQNKPNYSPCAELTKTVTAIPPRNHF